MTLRTFEFGDVRIDFAHSELVKGDRQMPLATKELQLLHYMVEHRDRVVPREELMQNVWEYSGQANSRTVDTHIAWLRQKIEDNPQTPRHIHTVRGKGYRFSAWWNCISPPPICSCFFLSSNHSVKTCKVRWTPVKSGLRRGTTSSRRRHS